MFVFLESLLRFFVAGIDTFWAGSEPGGTLALIGLVGLTAFAIILVARYHIPVAAYLGVDPAGPCSHEPGDISVLLSQSDPDADGHPRPRAPGRSLAAA